MNGEIQHVSIHGHDLAYYMEGKGPALLLLHGIAGSSRTWRDVMPRLTDRFTVIAPDLMGHGLSEKPVGDYSLGAFASGIRDLLEVLDIEHASVAWPCNLPTSIPSCAIVSCSWPAEASGEK
jgi:pimeloyl-ACP methyl ester carboxylesterase